MLTPCSSLVPPVLRTGFLLSIALLLHPGNARATDYFVENNILKITFNDQALLTSIVLKTGNRQLLEAPTQAFNYQIFTSSGLQTFVFDQLRKDAGQIYLHDSVRNVDAEINVRATDSYFVWTMSSLKSAVPTTDFRALTFKFIRLNIDCRGFACTDDSLFLIGMPLTANVGKELTSGFYPGFLFTGASVIGIPLTGAQFALGASIEPGAESFTATQLFARMKTDFGLQDPQTPPLTGPTLFLTGGSLATPADVDGLVTYMTQTGFQNVLLFQKLWKKGNGAWEIDRTVLPNGLESVVPKLHAAGLRVGLHWLSTVVDTNNAFFTVPNGLLRDSQNVPIHPFVTAQTGIDANGKPILTGIPSPNLYLLNRNDDAVLKRYVQTFVDPIHSLGIDFIYLDGLEYFFQTADPKLPGSLVYMDRLFEIFRKQLRPRIFIQGSTPGTYAYLAMPKQSMADGGSFFLSRQIKTWFDQTAVYTALDMRSQGMVPDLGWIWMYPDKDPREYAYALSAGIAIGGAFTGEGPLSNFQTPAFTPVFNDYFSVVSRYGGKSSLTALTGRYALTKYDRGLAGIYLFQNVVPDVSNHHNDGGLRVPGVSYTNAGCLTGGCLQFEPGGTLIVPDSGGLSLDHSFSFSANIRIDGRMSVDYFTSIKHPYVVPFIKAPRGFTCAVYPDGTIIFAMLEFESGLPGVGTKLTKDAWHHLVYSYDETSGLSELFVDGVSRKTLRRLVKTPLVRDAKLYIGDPDFIGRVDDVAVYPRVLTSNEVATLASQRNVPGASAEWTFDHPLGDVDETKASINVGDLREVWIHVPQKLKATVTLMFQHLKADMTYSVWMDKASSAYRSFRSDTTGAGQVEVSLDDSKIGYFMHVLEEGGTGVTGLFQNDLSQARVFPNPWRKDKHRALPVTFGRLTQHSQIKIFTVAGEWVRNLSGDETISWDLKDNADHPIASGIYLYKISNDQGQHAQGKLVVIK